MKFIKKLLLLIFLFLLATRFYPNKKPTFRLMINFNVNPFFYEHSFVLRGIGFNGSVFGGVNIGKFTVGVNASEKYYSFAPLSKVKNLNGAFSILNATLDTYIRPTKWLELKMALGGAWFKSAFNYSNIGWISYSLGGLSFGINSKFKPQWKGFKYMEIDAFTHLDLFFGTLETIPYFTGGMRFIFHPFLKWINLYLEVAAHPWQYKDDLVNIQTAMFIWSTGVSIDLNFPQVVNEMKILKNRYKEKYKVNNKVKDLTNDALDTKKIKIEETIYDKLAKSKIGTIFSFPQIKFNGKTTKFTNESYNILEELFDIMKKNPSIKIAISGYSDFTGKDVSEELTLSMKRAKQIKLYLEKKGIEQSRLKILASGQLTIEIQRIE